MNQRPISISPRGVMATLVVLAIAGVCVRLGLWQLDRLEQRRDLNAGIEARLAEQPAGLGRVPRDTAGWLYRRVTVSGEPDDDRSIVLPGRAWRGSPGVHVLTPVLLGDGEAVLVDRGWMPAADGATVDLEALPRTSSLSGVGLVRPFPGEDGTGSGRARPPDATAEEGFRRVWYFPDPAALRAQFPYELGAVSVQLIPDSEGDPFFVRQPEAQLDSGPHLGYAIQWFSFAAIAVIGWLVMVMKSGVAPSRNASQ